MPYSEDMRIHRFSRLAAVAVVAVTTTTLLGGCGTADETAGETAPQADAVTVSDAWVKAADEGMTGAFGVLTNDGADDATVVSAASAASPMVEIHETVMVDGGMKMQPKEGGVVVPAGGSATLQPGGDHIMLMDLAEPIAPGDEVVITLTFADGSTLDVTATAKTFTGGNEEYLPSEG